MRKLPLFTVRELQQVVNLAVQEGYAALPIQVTLQDAEGALQDFQVVGARFSTSSGLMYINAQERPK